MTNDEVTQALQHLVGTRYEPSIKATITELTGRKRVIGPTDISTREMDRNRIHVKVDQAGNITEFKFG